MKKKVLITGANGQLGSDIVSTLQHNNYEVIATTHSDFDIGNLRQSKQKLLQLKPEIVINTAAFHHVEKCENEPELAKLINAEAPANLASACREINALFVHISTDYVFDGMKKTPYLESDTPAPLNSYGKTKLLGEQMIAAAYYNHLILRVSALYGLNPCRAKNGLNFIQLMLKLAREKGEVKVVRDEYVSPTATASIAQQLMALIPSGINGVVHATSEGACSWYDFAAEIFEYTQTPVKLMGAKSFDFPAKVPRPTYSVLENSVLKNKGINIMPGWKNALHVYLDELNKSQKNV